MVYLGWDAALSGIGRGVYRLWLASAALIGCGGGNPGETYGQRNPQHPQKKTIVGSRQPKEQTGVVIWRNLPGSVVMQGQPSGMLRERLRELSPSLHAALQRSWEIALDTWLHIIGMHLGSTNSYPHLRNVETTWIK